MSHRAQRPCVLAALALAAVAAWPAAAGAALVAGFLRAERGAALVGTAGATRHVASPGSGRVELGDSVLTDEAFEGSLLLFDGSVCPLGSRTTVRVTDDGLRMQRKDGWPLVHGFRVPLDALTLNGDFPGEPAPGATWEGVGPCRLVTAAGATPLATHGELLANGLLETGRHGVARVDAGGRGVAVMRGATMLRAVPGGFGLEVGGAVVHLGSREESGLWTGRVRARATRAIMEVSSVGDRDTFRVLRGRVNFIRADGAKGRAVAGPGQALVAEGAGPLRVEPFKPRGSASKVAADLAAKLAKPLKEGFPRFVTEEARASAPAVPFPTLPPPGTLAPAPARPATPPPGSSEPSRPGPPAGQDTTGSEFLDPLRQGTPGESAGDWQTAR